MKRGTGGEGIAEHPNAVAVLVNNPTYYGISCEPAGHRKIGT